MNRKTLKYARQIVRKARRSRGHFNKSEFVFGRVSGSSDKGNSLAYFGKSCTKLTHSFCSGYYLGYKYHGTSSKE